MREKKRKNIKIAKSGTKKSEVNGKTVIKQLLDEVEHDIMNYQNRGLCYLPKPKAETDNTDTRYHARYHAKTEFNNCFIKQLIHNSSSETVSSICYNITYTVNPRLAPPFE